MPQNYVQYVKIKEKFFYFYFNRVISEYSCSHVAFVFPLSRL